MSSHTDIEQNKQGSCHRTQTADVEQEQEVETKPEPEPVGTSPQQPWQPPPPKAWTAHWGASDIVHDYWLDRHGPYVKGSPPPPAEVEEELRARLDQSLPNEPWADTYKDLAVAFAIYNQDSTAQSIQVHHQQKLHEYHLLAPRATSFTPPILFLGELAKLTQMLSRHR